MRWAHHTPPSPQRRGAVSSRGNHRSWRASAASVRGPTRRASGAASRLAPPGTPVWESTAPRRQGSQRWGRQGEGGAGSMAGRGTPTPPQLPRRGATGRSLASRRRRGPSKNAAATTRVVQPRNGSSWNDGGTRGCSSAWCRRCCRRFPPTRARRQQSRCESALSGETCEVGRRRRECRRGIVMGLPTLFSSFATQGVTVIRPRRPPPPPRPPRPAPPRAPAAHRRGR